MSGTPRVLVVDDDQIAGDLLREILTGEGYDVTVARNGAEALACVAECHFGLMITDLGLSGLGGLGLIVAVKHCRPGIPIVVLTASREQSTLRDAVRFGASRILLKPQRQADLVTVMHQMLPLE